MSAAEQDRYLRTGFLERIAHELRGPTSVVQGSIDELEHVLGEGAEAHRPLFSMLRRGIARLLRTATRLEQTGQLEGGTALLSAVRCDLCELVRHAVAGAGALEARRKIAVTIETPEGPLPCSVDPSWMDAALFELASNAIRHAGRRVTVCVTASAGAACVVFTDDNDPGKGFGPARFQPGQRRGLGLGLAIAQDVVLAHRGRLDIEPAPQGGARVRVTLPIETTAASPPDARELS